MQIYKLYGFSRKETGDPSNQLRKAGVTALDNSECLEFWSSDNLLDQHLCVMGMDTPEGAGACNVSMLHVSNKN